MIKRIRIFPTEIFVVPKSDNNVNIEELRNIILELESSNPGIRKSNYGGWHSRETLHTHPAFTKLNKHIKSNIFSVLTSLEDLVDIRITGSWANINRKGHVNFPHIHPGATFSCCYYIDNPSGNLILADPRAVRLMSSLEDLLPDEEPHRETYVITPKAGDLIIFPSWLEHSVSANKTDNPRITVASNIVVRRSGHE